ncbi:Uncharacterised protein [Mycobacteroides abscessus subsp. abscessus]|uniref:hypothetical protein n=1 Tax=Mycobacteroides abscessus TaxID=36809 RepID=UPI00092A84BD|nr:hypothetical protein [Mycobacteroides abscessus]SHX67115.1 Uncharacterised protein [Mycobacteroides abscessus subsp. abscessus]SIC59419.1 Uncharacterised protein [Mycobacteroides abscessus subsp. abscessus]SKK20199.1 Uncharacterised protein [Mycobacteroides abscessus subsp. abscessus]SKP49959.1 Uncharacterised protein [Mycobacteroides abscessus subsp. abscessus]SKR42020.1 Uncharacterised protein [Mycobacteroides abscessus subsp. abscessus]
MKVPGSWAAARRYDIHEDRLGRYPEVPEDIGPVHALLFDPPKPPQPGAPPQWKRRPEWLDRPKFHEPIFLEGYNSEEAACGRRVRLVFPVPFDTDEDDVCPECREMAQLWVGDRPAFDARVREREERRREKVHRQWEAQQAEVDYAEFLRRQDAALWEGKVPPTDQDEDDELAL